MISNSKPSATLVVLALIVVQVLFGINYVVSKFVVEAFPPLVWASFRIVVSALVMVSAALFLKRPHPSDGKKFFGPLVGLALLGTIINQGSFLVGIHYTTATNSAIINTMIPVFTLLIVTLRGQEPLTRSRAIGFLFAFLGVLILRKMENFSFSDKTLIGDLLMLVNCFSYGLFLSFGKNFLEKHDRVWTTAWLFVYGSVGLTAVASPYWATFEWPPLLSNPTLLACMAFAIIGGTILTYFLNFWALAYTKSSSVALFIYLQPVVASVLAWGWFGEVITPRTVLSSVLIFVGVIFALPRDNHRMAVSTK